MEFILKLLYNSQFAADTIDPHANKGKDEMQQLNDDFLSMINSHINSKE